MKRRTGRRQLLCCVSLWTVLPVAGYTCGRAPASEPIEPSPSPRHHPPDPSGATNLMWHSLNPSACFFSYDTHGRRLTVTPKHAPIAPQFPRACSPRPRDLRSPTRSPCIGHPAREGHRGPRRDRRRFRPNSSPTPPHPSGNGVEPAHEGDPAQAAPAGPIEREPPG